MGPFQSGLQQPSQTWNPGTPETGVTSDHCTPDSRPGQAQEGWGQRWRQGCGEESGGILFYLWGGRVLLNYKLSFCNLVSELHCLWKSVSLWNSTIPTSFKDVMNMILKHERETRSWRMTYTFRRHTHRMPCPEIKLSLAPFLQKTIYILPCVNRSQLISMEECWTPKARWLLPAHTPNAMALWAKPTPAGCIQTYW